MQRDQAHRTNELLERIAIALEKNNKKENVRVLVDEIGTNNIHENTLSDKCLAANCDGDECTHNDYDDDIHNDYLSDLVKDMTLEQYAEFHREESLSFAQDDAASMTNFIYSLEYEECLGAIRNALIITEHNSYVKDGIFGVDYVKNLIKEETTTPTSDNPDPDSYGNKEYETDLQGIRKDDDHDIRLTAHTYEAAIDEDLHTKKDCILDYVTNEFGILGARYTDIIKFAYYLGSPNAPKYTSANRGYYAMAFAPRYGGHLIQGGKDQLVKGINNEGDERYFALSFVESATAYWKRIE